MTLSRARARDAVSPLNTDINIPAFRANYRMPERARAYIRLGVQKCALTKRKELVCEHFNFPDVVTR